MIKLKKLRLKNFCGFINSEFDFTNSSNLVVFFGGNGMGKSTLLNAIYLLSSPWEMRSRKRIVQGVEGPINLFLRKLTYDSDYLISVESYQRSKNHMKAEAIFEIDNSEKSVIIQNTNELERDKDGIVVNELPNDKISYAYYINSDHPVDLNCFQLEERYKDLFLEIAEVAYDLKCEIPEGTCMGVEEQNKETGEYVLYHTDFVIYKKNKKELYKTHFKKMSVGEKKLAKLISIFCSYKDYFDIFLIDDIDRNIYFKKHLCTISKIYEKFCKEENKQIFCSTHSGIIVNELDKKHLFEINYE